jgi:flagellar hook-associated protein 1
MTAGPLSTKRFSMSLFGSIQLAKNTLQATQIGLQVVGQNISNANTPGYIREQVIYQPAPVQKIGDLVLGTGVDIAGIVQVYDKFVLDRLRGATSDRASTTVQEEAFRQLETVVGELSDTDISTSLTNFFASIADVLNQPESVAVRNLAVLRGESLTADINSLARRVQNLRFDANSRVLALGEEINTLTEQIAELNRKIAFTELGTAKRSEAGALRDQRNNALERLSEIVDIRASEQPSGAINVSVGGELLVVEGDWREVNAALTSDRGMSIATIQFANTQSPLFARAGELVGHYEARDSIIGGFSDQLNDFTEMLVNEFNKAFSQGQGLTGFTEVTSEHAAGDASAPLDAAGLPFTPVNGAFDVLVRNTRTGLASTSTILIDLNGLDQDLSLNGLAAALSDVDGITATVGPNGDLTVQSDAPDTEFAFSGDTSGVLAALGINTFFSGTTAGNVGVNEVIARDPAKFAASGGGVGEDTDNAIRLAALLNEPLTAQGGVSIAGAYDRITSDLTQGSAVAAGVAEGIRTYETTLESEHLSISSVNLDEEAVRLITLQRTYQATARYIGTLSDLLDVLVNL